MVIGAGDRGFDAYATLLLEEPQLGRIVAVADPDLGHQERLAQRFGLRSSDCYPG